MQCFFALSTMHQKGILHRDIKPENMFLTKNDVIKLGDFGIAKESDYAKTMVGTPYFMSPEVCKGEKYGSKADIWAFGCAIYEMCTLRKPFMLNGNNDINQLFNLIKTAPYEPIPESVSTEMRELVSHCLRKNPGERPELIEIYKNYPFLHEVAAEYCQTYPEYKKMIDEYLEKDKKAHIL